MQVRLRTLIDQVARSVEADVVLLRRFVSTRDHAAFAELVRRYGRLVWGQCRHLLQSETDADDAFQATFLTLSRGARTLKDTNKLGPWLHGVAYRVCLNAKRLAARRGKREKATAKPEAVRPVADSAWDAAFAAVHDELAKLPETLRAPFVLCVLEGKGTTQAAEQLGLKLGTFSARLSRAKQTLFERLNARGLTAGLATVGAVALGASSVPAAVVTKACDLAVGGTAPANILSLSHGVLGMAAMNAKRWVMSAVLACGLTAGAGGVLTANAQQPPPKKETPADVTKQELAELKKKLEAEATRLRDYKEQLQKQSDDAKRKSEKEWLAERELWIKKMQEGEQRNQEALKSAPEFLYYGQGAGYSPTAADFEKTVKDVEAKGYSFVGVVTMKGQTKAKDNEAVPTLVFRRAAMWTVKDKEKLDGMKELKEKELFERKKEKELEGVFEKKKDLELFEQKKEKELFEKKKELEEVYGKKKADDRSPQERELQAQIEKLTAELNKLTGKKGEPAKEPQKQPEKEKQPAKQPEKEPQKEKQPSKLFEKKPADDGVFVGMVSDLGGEPEAAAKLVTGLVRAKLGTWGVENVKVVAKDKGVYVYGVPAEKLEWLMGVIKQVSPGGKGGKKE